MDARRLDSKSDHIARSNARHSGGQMRTLASRVGIPVAFVLCWSSGFVVPRAFARYSEPLTFTTLRNAGAALVLILIAIFFRCPWPRSLRDKIGIMWSGALL